MSGVGLILVTRIVPLKPICSNSFLLICSCQGFLTSRRARMGEEKNKVLIGKGFLLTCLLHSKLEAIRNGRHCTGQGEGQHVALCLTPKRIRPLQLNLCQEEQCENLWNLGSGDERKAFSILSSFQISHSVLNATRKLRSCCW